MGFHAVELEQLYVVLFAAVTLLAGLLFLLKDIGRVIRQRVQCPVDGRPADVDFLFDATNPQVVRDVTSCSLFSPGGAINCGKLCQPRRVY